MLITLLLSYTTQFLLAEGTALSVFYRPDEEALNYFYNRFNCAAEANGLITVVHLCYRCSSSEHAVGLS